MQAVLAFITGCFAGLVHVWSGPDHLAAVAPLSLNRRRQPWTLGMRWGMGHSAGVLLIGVVSLCFREVLPLNAVSSVAERLVGVMLIGIGIWGIRKAFSQRVHSHPHTHGGDRHAHFHVHGGDTVHRPEENRGHTHSHAALAIGALHGVAGSSHVIGVLPALALPSSLAAGGYLMGYAVGTVFGMAAFSSAMGWMQRWRALSGRAGYSRVMCVSSCVAFAMGVYWIC
jgi:ABC-type nickel/cobalt efflux system permease component RcnA